MNATDPPDENNSGSWRWTYGLWVVVGGFCVVLITFAIAVIVAKDKGSVPGMFSGVTGVVGTLVGAYFGVQSGQSARKAAEAGRNEAEAGRDEAVGKALQLAAVAPKELSAPIVGVSLPPDDDAPASRDSDSAPPR
ncbi:hypothetical protein SAMN05428945_2395 [Streptomyces sp. 2224.1]|uniref:hypothetical protein n=1 Tax=unclassified Streptomyces TaxID=2593676 RepID=UPI0008801CF8|nr:MULTISPECIES: hypothetical protein [unclassified Streptomyces]PBC83010.1 hypothetical protein BX261_2935 [Streptomyces sp. 2321.6]SDR45666.1 hypothetical protein SAMN05216511_4267 [Streptomyces sp. KS_16]SEC24327.1 hypothetical protein SAMN05428945_2395 [Streptomyces sp. 2224.1]SEC80528.1 hypothetical protein SAMN05428940_2938 [Streptomyces sp. 2133.1]SEE87931.1 hypothetical protein SAMN05428954_4302 [Streptomyces sp. 2112.3]